MPQDQLKIHAFRLQPGQDLKTEIDTYAQHHRIGAGWIKACVGSLTQYHLRFANQPNGTRKTGFFEIISLTGTVSRNGSHLHIGISDETGNTIGGHLLKENLVYTTAEIVIGEALRWEFTRELDGTTKWKELQIRQT